MSNPPVKRQKKSGDKTAFNDKNFDTSQNGGVSQREKNKLEDRVNDGKTHLVLNAPCLFVGNLHPHIVPDIHLRKLFQSYGSIERISSIKFKSGPRAGQLRDFAFVEFASIDSARKAMNALNGRSLIGRKLSVAPADKKTPDKEDLATNVRRDSLLSGDVKKIRKEKSEIEKKIEAVKRAIEEKKRKHVDS